MNNIVEIEFLNIEENDIYIKTIENVVNKCFEEEKLLETKLHISVILTDADEIQRLNREYRKIDKTTDVLSFPIFTREEIHNINKDIPENLGDIVISIEKVSEQAKEYEHSFERELSYMVVHGFYHLMGYDHIDNEDKKEMREKEENVLNKLNIVR